MFRDLCLAFTVSSVCVNDMVCSKLCFKIHIQTCISQSVFQFIPHFSHVQSIRHKEGGETGETCELLLYVVVVDILLLWTSTWKLYVLGLKMIHLA